MINYKTTNKISVQDIKDINSWIRNTIWRNLDKNIFPPEGQRRVLPNDFEYVWKTDRGVITKRIFKAIKDIYGIKLTDSILSELGQFLKCKFEGLEKEYNFAYMDPALGSIGKGDNDLIVVLYCARKENTIYIRDSIITNTTTPDEVIKQMKELYIFYDCSYVGVESNGYQTLFAKAVREEDMIVSEVRSNKPKVIRIESIAPAVSSVKVRFRDDWKAKYPELIEQLIIYPVGKNDDVPDSIHGALKSGLGKLTGIKKEKLTGLVSSKTGLLRGKIYGRYSHEKAKEARGWRSRNRA